MRTRTVAMLLVVLGLATVSGCATDQAKKKPVDVIWPLPPEPTRIRYLRSYTSSADVLPEKGFFDVVGELFAGPKEETKFKKPFAVAVDSRGRMFVTDTGWGQLLVFDEANHNFAMWGESGAGLLKRPTGVAVDAQDNVYVADAAAARVVSFKPDGTFLRAYGRAGELTRPGGLAVDQRNKWLYVIDVGQHQVAVYDLEGTQRLRVIGKRGDGDSDFNFPTFVAVGSDGNLFVMDSFHFRVKVFDPQGKYLSGFGCNGTSLGCFSRAKGIDLDSEGHIYVVDAAFNVVQIFDQQGRLLLFFGGGGQGPGQMWLPAGLFIDQRDRIYIADQYNWRINVFQYIAHPEEAASQPSSTSDTVDQVVRIPADQPVSLPGPEPGAPASSLPAQQ